MKQAPGIRQRSSLGGSAPKLYPGRTPLTVVQIGEMTGAAADPTIRPATLDDAAAIAAFNAAMARDTEHLELDQARLLQGVRSVLSDAGKGFYIVAEAAGRLAGQMLITYEWSDWRNGNFWWIQSVYVHPDFRHRGVFRAIYRHVAEMAGTTPGVCGLRLYVEGENYNAQTTYERIGMRRTSYAIYEVDFVLGR